MDAELLGRIRKAMDDATSGEDPVFSIAEEVTDYFTDFIEELEDAVSSQRVLVSSLPTMLEDGTMIEVAIHIQKFVSPDGDATFSLHVAGTADQPHIVGLLELAKMQTLMDDDA